MHFCPRCLHAYHASCLRKAGFIDEHISVDEVTSRNLQMEVAVAELMLDPAHHSPSKPNPGPVQSQPMATDQVSGDNWESLSSATLSPDNATDWYWDRHALLSEHLLALARSPMVKGDGALIPNVWSVTGNYAVVSRARVLVAGVALYSKDLAKEWLDYLDLPFSDDMLTPNITNWIVADCGFRCSECGGPI